MASERKSSCWTCRLRRKKCDEGTPKCRNCTTLEISCYGGTIRPEWMDGGMKQKEMAESIKAQIKRSANVRRKRQINQVATIDSGDWNFVIESGQNQPTLETMQIFNPTPPSDVDNRMQHNASVLDFLDEYEEFHDDVPILSRGRDFEIDFLMKYLDYVFPLMFPFYRPGIQETGRSWILTLLRRSRVAFHSAMSLCVLFFIFTLIDVFPGQHDDCKSQLWQKVGRQADICFEMIQQDIQDLRLRGSESTLIEKIRVMESIIQFLIFEVSLSRSANWNLHLTPALALYEEIWQSTVTEESESEMLAVLDAMSLHLRFGFGFGFDNGGYVWSPEQAGFRFFTCLLVFIDIIASTSLEQPPRLTEYHPHLLAEIDYGKKDFNSVPVQLSGFIGCQNWVLLVVSRISLLDVWKKDMKKAAKLSMVELVDRANQISRTLNDGISHLDELASDPEKDNSINSRSYFNSQNSASSRPSITPTKIWAHAAHIYLSVVVSGWQPSNAEIRSSVSQILKILRTVDSPTHLRTLAWPICVAGCVSEEGDYEQEFRHLFAGVDEFTMIGALGEAQKIMERVWKNRETLNRETWDLAACFRVLGTPALLV